MDPRDPDSDKREEKLDLDDRFDDVVLLLGALILGTVGGRAAKVG